MRTALMMCALLLAGCGGSFGGTCQTAPSPPSLAGTPIPAQPIPQGAGVTASVSVVVTAVVNANGSPIFESIQTSSHNAVIDSAALSVVRNSKFNPGLAGCSRTTPSETSVTVPFSPNPMH